MSRTIIDVDEAALAEAMKEYGTTKKVVAVNRALQDAADRREEKLRKAFKVWDRMAENMSQIDWHEAYHRHGD